MSRTATITAIVASVLGLLVGYSMAGVGGALVWAVLWGFGGLLVGRAIVSTGALVSRYWWAAIGVALFVVAVVLTWGLRF